MLLIVDANVLIDYLGSDPGVLSLASRYLGTVFVATPLLREVSGLSQAKARRLELSLVEPTLPQLLEAAGRRGPLSFEDRLCLILARDAGWTCVTNDRRLRRECTESGVEVLWGLELMLRLVARDRLDPQEALEVVMSIHEANPHHVHRKIVQRFRIKIGLGTK